MTQLEYILDLARHLGLDAQPSEDAGGATMGRHGLCVRLPQDILAHLDPTTVLGRHLAWSVLLGVRLGLDHRLCAYQPDMERTGAQALYGERMPRLVPPATVAWVEAVSGAPVLCDDWLIAGLKLIYVLETGKFLHTLTLPELGELTISPEKLRADARHALFYDAYRLKPAQKLAVEGGEIRIFRTTEGLGATRALLLPDFDYDAAREAGSFAIPCRDTLLIGRPRECDAADIIRAEVARQSADLLHSATFPLSDVVFQLSHDRVRPAQDALGSTPGAHPLQTLASYPALIEAVLPGEIHVEPDTRL